MARRSVAWEEGLAEDLKDPDFTRQFIKNCLEDNMSLQVVLSTVIKCMGVKEFAKKVKMPSSNVLRAINPKHNPTQETLNRLLKPLGLKLTVEPINKENKAA